MKTVAWSTLTAIIDKTIDSRPQFSIQSPILNDFGILGGAQNRPSETRNSGWDLSWSLPRTILAPTSQFSWILNRFWSHLGCLWGPFYNIPYIFWRISAVVDRLAAFIAAQHCIRTNQKKTKQGIPINKQTIKPTTVIPHQNQIASNPQSLTASKLPTSKPLPHTD